MKRPNILFFFTDQQRADTCGCYGQRLNVTPRLDAFAARATLFENAFTCQPVCGPARAALQTGRWPASLGCQVNGLGLPTDVDTIAREFNAAGYLTGYCGKWHLASTHGVNSYEISAIPEEFRGGYRDFWIASDVLEFTSHGYGGHMFRADGSRYEWTGYRADAVTDAALEFIDGDRPDDKPFFMMISYIEPHHQNDHNCYEGPYGSRERFADYDVPGDLEGTQGDWRANYPDYLGCVNSLDSNFGRILDALERRGELDNTVVVYSSDHGSHFCTRNMEYKRSCHDGCTHIPLLISGPGFERGVRDKRMVSLMDIPSTLLNAAGIAVPGDFCGAPLQAANAQNWTDSVYMQISESHTGRAVRTERYLYAVGAPGATYSQPYADEYMETYLYDNERDPYQRVNLVRDPAYAQVRDEMRTRMLAHMKAAGEPDAVIRPMTDSAADQEYFAKISAHR